MEKYQKQLLFLFAAALCFLLSSCTASSENLPSVEKPPENADSFSERETFSQTEEKEMKETQFYIKANGTSFAADFADNTSADAFRELLREGDLSVNMHDYGNFEKVGEIGHRLVQNNTPITTEPGDVILYLGENITIYYDRNSWNFTRLGKIRNVNKDDLLSVLGSGNVQVVFSLSE